MASLYLTLPPSRQPSLLDQPDVLVRRAFRAMNTSVEVTLTNLSAVPALVEVEHYFQRFETRFSRFLPDSELSSLNARDGEVASTPEMLGLLTAAQTMHRRTGGVFDPGILPTLEGLGYDRSFEQIGGRAAPIQARSCSARFGELRLDVKRGVVYKPKGLRIDLGGIGKGFAVDQAATMLRPSGPAFVNAGGDIFAVGEGARGGGWQVGIQDPHDGKAMITTVVLRDQAIATSSTVARAWESSGRRVHHVLDPRSLAPTRNGLMSTTVIAPSATEADVFAKTALILGYRMGGEFLEGNAASGLFVFADGSTRRTDTWPGTIEGRS